MRGGMPLNMNMGKLDVQCESLTARRDEPDDDGAAAGFYGDDWDEYGHGHGHG